MESPVKQMSEQSKQYPTNTKPTTMLREEEERTQSKLSQIASVAMLDATDRIFEQTPESAPVAAVEEDVQAILKSAQKQVAADESSFYSGIDNQSV
jgi:hypothetical protein